MTVTNNPPPADVFALLDEEPAVPRATRASDPPTGLVRGAGFRELLPGSVVDDTYEIDARLGAGAMGEVYAAHHVKLGKRVAIKVIGKRLSDDEDAIARFAQEARTLAQIQHPAIVAVDHVGELSDGRAYFVMEYLRGESLFERMTRGRLPLQEALRVVDQMARGLEAAHGQGVVHRDLKPENVFLVHLPDELPIVKLLDFGLAKLAETHDKRVDLTQSGVAIGTPMYMSPEQARGAGVDRRTDIYALGCVAYELLLGEGPFSHAKTVPELYAAHLHETPTLPRTIWPEAPPPLDLVLFAMLAKDPAHRPTLAQVRSVVADVHATPAQRAPTEFVGPRAAILLPRKILLAASVIALGAGLAIGLGIGGRAAPATTPASTPAMTPATTPTALSAPPIHDAPILVDAVPAADATGSMRVVDAVVEPPISRPRRPIAPLRQKPRANDVVPVPVPARPRSEPAAEILKTGRDQTVNPFVHHKTVEEIP